MNIPNVIPQLDIGLRLAAEGLATTGLAWLFAMLAALLSRRRETTGVRWFEIAVVACSLLFIASTAHMSRAMKQVPEVTKSEAPAGSLSGNGTGTCASVRHGMKADEVSELLGTPSIQQDREDALGPGASVMVFDNSHCVVHFIHGVVTHVE